MQRLVKNISICSFTFLLLLILTGIAAAAPVDSGQKVIIPSFSDVSSSDGNAIYINYMAKRGLISGFPDGSFHPTEGLTRAQAATLLCLVKGLDATNAVQSGFSDVDNSHWAAGYINAASQAGYITGFPDNTYQPEAILTRAQGISLFLRLSSNLDVSLELPPLDDMDMSHWAASSMANALVAGMISKDGNKIYPEQSFARGDLAKALSILITKDPGLNQTVLNGKLKVKSGDVRLKRAGNDKAQPMTSTSIVKTGDTITTGKDGEAEIVYPDGSGILLKCNSELIIKSAKGRTYIKSDGNSGIAVDDLELELKNGTIFGALASKYTSSTEENKTASRDRYKLLASRDKNFDLVAAKKETEPWYKTAEKKKVKVKVDMPWGVAAIRGTFWSNTVSSTYCGMTILVGDGDLSGGGQTHTLSPGQSSGINQQGNPPSPPGPMSPSEAGEWSRQRGWVLERGGDIQNNRGLGEHGDNHDGLGDESDNKLGELQTTLNNALNQTLNRVKQIPTAISSGGGNSGVGGSGSVITRVAAPVANVLSGIYSQPLNISLSSATEGATIYFTTDGSDPKTSSTREIFSTLLNINVNTTIKAYATKPGMTDSDVVNFAYTINLPLPLQVDVPTASPLPGVFTLTIKVNLSTTTEGASIFYTTDGSDPKTSLTRALFSTLLNINVNTTIKVYATKEGMTDSDVVTFNYTINLPSPLQVAAPTADPQPETYTGTQYITMSCATDGATIYYTTDGSDPTDSNNNARMEYSEHICVEETTTIKAYATKEGMTDSDVVSFDYIITVTGNQSAPSLAYNEEYQKYLMVYEKHEGNNSIICGQIWPIDGTSQGAEFTISGLGVNREPTVALDPNSMNYLVLWSDQGDTPAISGQLVNHSGNLEGNSFTVYADENNKPQFKPNIAYYYSGPLVVWQEGDSSSDSTIMGRFITFNDNTPNMGEPISFSQATGNEPIMFSQGAGNQYDPAVACNNGEYLVVFNDGNNLKGILIGEGYITNPVSIPSGNGIQGAGAVIPIYDYNSEYRFLVAWQDQQDGNFDIMARFVGTTFVGNTPTMVLSDELTITDSSNQETCPSLASIYDHYLIAWQDKSLDNDIKARMLYPDGTPAGSVKTIAPGTGEQLHPVMTSMNSKVIVAYEDQGTSPYTIGRYLFDESLPPKADWIIITNNATGNDEVTTPYESPVIPVGAVVTVYDGNSSLLGSEAAQWLGGDGYYPPHIYIEGGFAPGVEGIYVTTTLEGNQESETTYVTLPIPVMNKYTDFDVDNCDYGYGKITYIVTPAQKAAMEAATGKTIATIKAYTTTNIETTFADLTAAEATGGVEILITDDGNDTNDYVSVEKDPGNYGYAIAAYDSYGQVVAYYVSTEWVTVYAPAP